jgi:hypothetical protein
MSNTAYHYFAQLPDFYAEKAIYNAYKGGTGHIIYEDLEDALISAFQWEHTPEGHYFWQDLYELIENEYIYLNN